MVQVAAGLPRQAVLVGHGAGALVVAHALARYPARAGVLVAPVFGGWATLGAALRAQPVRHAAGRVRRAAAAAPAPAVQPDAAGRAGPRRTPAGSAGPSPRAQWELLRAGAPEPPVGDPPVLVVGSPDDRVVPRSALDRAARRYGGAPLLFPGMGHDLMLDAGWREPIDAILDWLEKELAA